MFLMRAHPIPAAAAWRRVAEIDINQKSDGARGGKAAVDVRAYITVLLPAKARKAGKARGSSNVRALMEQDWLYVHVHHDIIWQQRRGTGCSKPLLILFLTQTRRS